MFRRIEKKHTNKTERNKWDVNLGKHGPVWIISCDIKKEKKHEASDMVSKNTIQKTMTRLI